MSLNKSSDYLQEIIDNDNLNSKIKDTKLNKYLKILSGKIERQKGVYTVLICLCLYKIKKPEQDIRYHKTKLKNGFSCRTFDTKYVTPVLKRNKLPSMSESGYLTRSLEQLAPYNLNYPGQIADTDAKESFLHIIDIFQKRPNFCREIIIFLINEGKKIRTKNFIPVKKIESKDEIIIKNLIQLIISYSNINFKVSGAAKIPVLSIYTIYQILTKEVKRYQNLNLKEMGFHTTSDKTSKSSGDIEIFDDKNLIESMEIKFNKDVDEHLMEIVYDKIKKFNPQRYYILHTVKISKEIWKNLEKKIEKIRNEHGCQVVISNLYSTLSKYLRLINNIQDYINLLSSNITSDKELKLIHKRTWKEIIEKEFK